MNIFVGNLSRDVQEDDVRKAFEVHGAVSAVHLIKDRVTGEPRGFGFVEMPVVAEGQKAISTLNGTELMGRAMNVSEARPREPRAFGGGGGGERRGGFGGGGSRGGERRGGFGGSRGGGRGGDRRGGGGGGRW